MDLNNQKSCGRLASFFDAGTFTEMGACMKKKTTDELSAVVCGYGSLKGRLVFAFSQESQRMSGAFDALHAQKIEMLFDAAVKSGAPWWAFSTASAR